MQLSSAFLVAVTASVASAAGGWPNSDDSPIIPINDNGPYCDTGSASSACERLGLHGYCCTDLPTPGRNNYLRGVTAVKGPDGKDIGCGKDGAKIWCAV
ncbi:hypothetical protein E4U44_002009 [Claviceps purpurea]|nr:hypothetical protein E4U26_008212 [Claviceps purpurea]KAG6314249.1 hypothetical protein E4U44_002009 [Claviceps purpurea]